MKAIVCDYCADVISKGEPVFKCVHASERINQIAAWSGRIHSDNSELNCEICAMRFGQSPGNVYQVLGDDYDHLKWEDYTEFDDDYVRTKQNAIGANNGHKELQEDM